MSEKNTFRIANLSGGKDSTAMLILLIERGMPIDLVISADTGMEYGKQVVMQCIIGKPP